MARVPMSDEVCGVHENNPPRSLEERLGVESGHDSWAALAISRCRGEFEAWGDLEPWQRIGPELLEFLAFGSEGYADRFLRECIDYLVRLEWIQHRAMTHAQLVLVAEDAFHRTVYRRCRPSDARAKSAHCRKADYQRARDEGVGFFAQCISEAWHHYALARHGNQ